MRDRSQSPDGVLVATQDHGRRLRRASRGLACRFNERCSRRRSCPRTPFDQRLSRGFRTSHDLFFGIDVYLVQKNIKYEPKRGLVPAKRQPRHPLRRILRHLGSLCLTRRVVTCCCYRMLRRRAALPVRGLVSAQFAARLLMPCFELGLCDRLPALPANQKFTANSPIRRSTFETS